MADYKTPGVYIVEKPAFPNSVVEVATAVPAFIGYTQKAARGTTPLTNVPTRLTTMTEFEDLFGGPPDRLFNRTVNDDETVDFTEDGQAFYLYNSMRIFFNNGGGPCWIVSIGGYAADQYGQGDFTDAMWQALAKEQEPTMYVVPDAVALNQADYNTISGRMVKECTDLQSRVAILDIYDGANPDIDTVINGEDGFRQKVVLGDKPSYGMVYYPWLNSTVTSETDVMYTNLTEDSRGALKEEIDAEQAALASAAGKTVPPAVTALIARLTEAPSEQYPALQTHLSLKAISPTYVEVMKGLLKAMNVLPPSGAMAGVYTRTDNTFGVFKAPANTGIMSCDSPTVAISSEQQQDLNVPLDGKAVNAIRTFMGRGVLVWGARTLDGNSQDFRYINVRRTLIMLEQSVYYAALAYVFAPNDAGTWQTVKTMLENFLNNQWKAGALAGSKPADAYDVSVGLGSTMTGNDILDGYMRVTVRVAITRPAEFIVITFQQKMQTS
ncbi:phage tail sheath family protein [Thalassococcus sp. BH17M4-6]|uniref:phage tail sheath family protein n=1 Tax=Thalassococcus sp. BH17M4-6 TaxID=3413148 RepID=UPI003BDCA666